MQLGAVFPTTEVGNDPAAVRDYAQAAEALGYRFITLVDHVLGAAGAMEDGPRAAYGHSSTPFHEPFVTLSFMAAWTRTVELSTSVLVLPQRQTVLVAKQAGELQVLSGGRLRLGIGTGWNALEYAGLGVDFASRGKRLDEQVTLLRALWSAPSVTHDGPWEQVVEAAINPRPQTPIPLWFGGTAEPALRRAAAVGDGWLPEGGPRSEAARLQHVRGLVREAGRDAGTFGVQAGARYAGGDPERWATVAARWRELGATYLAVATTGAGLDSVDAHIAALRAFRDATGTCDQTLASGGMQSPQQLQ